MWSDVIEGAAECSVNGVLLGIFVACGDGKSGCGAEGAAECRAMGSLFGLGTREGLCGCGCGWGMGMGNDATGELGSLKDMGATRRTEGTGEENMMGPSTGT